MPFHGTVLLLFIIGIYYLLLLFSGSSDPNSGFKACATLGGGMLDLTTGISKDLQSKPAIGISTGWTEKGYKPVDTMAVWGYFMFWSNATMVQ